MTRPKTTLTGDQVVANAEKLAPAFRERAKQTDHDRGIPSVSFQEMQEAGLFHMFKPRKYGGFELGAYDHARVTLALARGCASSAWVFTLLNTDSIFALAFPEEAQEELWGDDTFATIAGSTFLNPKSKATRVDGGYRLTGSWSFNSGSDHASWMLFHALVDDDKTGHMFLVPKKATSTVDDWFTTGMRGTGSRSIEAEDVFVPAYRAIPADQLIGQSKYNLLHPEFDLLQTNARFHGLYMLSAVMVGTGQAAVKFFADSAGDLRRLATGLGGELKLAEQEYVATQFTEASGDLDLAETKILEGSRLASEMSRRREDVAPALMVKDLRDNALIARVALRSVSTIHSLIGAKGCAEGHPVSRNKRDIEMASNHVGLNWRQASLAFAASVFGGSDSVPEGRVR